MLCAFSCQSAQNKLSLTKNIKSPKRHQRVLAKDKQEVTGCMYNNEVTSLGIGLVIAPDKLNIYNDSLLTSKFVSYSIYHENKISVCPKYYEPDYGIMHFVCLKKTLKSYQILINYSEVKYFPRTGSYKFEDWKEYILNAPGIRRLTHENDGSFSFSEPLRKSPNSSDTLSLPKGLEMFCAMDVSGDWLKVSYDCYYNNENNPYEGQPCHDYINKCKTPLTGWLRWRKDNKVLVDILLAD